MPTPPNMPLLFGVLCVLCLLLLLIVFVLVWRVKRLVAQLEEETFRRQSLSVTYGRISEQWFPFMPDYPYDPQNFRFLGSPVDGVQFEDDCIVFIEFKANQGRLSDRQRRLKKLVEAGEIYWEEFYFTAEKSK